MKKTVMASLAVALAGAAANSWAQDTAPAAAGAEEAVTSPWSGSLTLATQYVARGIRQTWGQPAVQGGIHYAHPDGFFGGLWASNVSGKFIEGGNIETDVYAGYSKKIGDITYTGGLFAYLYPGAKMSAFNVRYDYIEAMLGFSYEWLSVKYYTTVSKDYFGFNGTTLGVGDGKRTRGSGYLDITGDFDLGDGYALQLHYGHQRVRHYSNFNWQDAKVALSKNFNGGWNLTGGITKAWNKHGVYKNYTTGAPDANGNLAVSNPLKTTVFATLTKSF